MYCSLFLLIPFIPPVQAVYTVHYGIILILIYSQRHGGGKLFTYSIKLLGRTIHIHFIVTDYCNVSLPVDSEPILNMFT